MFTESIFNICGKDFYFFSAPHLKNTSDWHDAFADIIEEILKSINATDKPIGVPRYPLISDLPRDDLLFELGSYWEGAIYFLREILEVTNMVAGVNRLMAVSRESLNLHELLFMIIWNGHEQLKWLKAHFIREDAMKNRLLTIDQITSYGDVNRIGVIVNDENLIWLANFIEQHEAEGLEYPNPYFGGSNPLHLGLVKKRQFK